MGQGKDPPKVGKGGANGDVSPTSMGVERPPCPAISHVWRTLSHLRGVMVNPFDDLMACINFPARLGAQGTRIPAIAFAVYASHVMLAWTAFFYRRELFQFCP